jgi:TonB family protein
MGIALEPMGKFPFAPQERSVRLATKRQWVVSVVVGLWLVTAGVAIAYPSLATAQEEAKAEEKPDELTRKPKFKVAPVYPDIARRLSISGTVRLSVTVAPNGNVKSSKVVGGHPALVNAAMDAVKQWKFEPAPNESNGIVEFKFRPQN